jgi:hypothetical protein
MTKYQGHSNKKKLFVVTDSINDIEITWAPEKVIYFNQGVP